MLIYHSLFVIYLLEPDVYNNFTRFVEFVPDVILQNNDIFFLKPIFAPSEFRMDTYTHMMINVTYGCSYLSTA